MRKRLLGLIVFLIFIVGVISLYVTFAYNEEAALLDESTADYNLVYSLKNMSNKIVLVNSKDEKYVDVTLNNTYEYTIRYGMYYKLTNFDNLPAGVSISLAKESVDKSEDIIKPHGSKTVSIKIVNDSEYNVELMVGALIGFENGNIQDLIVDNEVLIK